MGRSTCGERCKFRVHSTFMKQILDEAKVLRRDNVFGRTDDSNFLCEVISRAYQKSKPTFNVDCSCKLPSSFQSILRAFVLRISFINFCIQVLENRFENFSPLKNGTADVLILLGIAAFTMTITITHAPIVWLPTIQTYCIYPVY